LALPGVEFRTSDLVNFVLAIGDTKPLSVSSLRAYNLVSRLSIGVAMFKKKLDYAISGFKRFGVLRQWVASSRSATILVKSSAWTFTFHCLHDTKSLKISLFHTVTII